MRKKAGLLFIIIIIAIAIAIALFFAIQYSARSPEAAIRRHLFLNNPAQSLTCDISQTSFVDEKIGRQYTIKGFFDSGSGYGIYFAYVKKNSLGFYHWTGGGSGP